MVNNKFDLASQLIDNLKKGFLPDEQGNPLKFYHGTAENFKNYGVSKHTGLFYGSANAEFANTFATEGPGANVRPSYIKSSKPWDFRNEAHREELSGILKNKLKTPDFQTRFAPVLEGLTEERQLEKLNKFAEWGNWAVIEHKSVLDELKAKGYDGVFTKESNALNFGTFYPENIVPAFEVESRLKDLEAMRAVDGAENITKPARQVIDTTTSKIPFKKIDKSKTILKAINVTPGKSSNLGPAAKAISVALRRKL